MSKGGFITYPRTTAGEDRRPREAGNLRPGSLWTSSPAARSRGLDETERQRRQADDAERRRQFRERERRLQEALPTDGPRAGAPENGTDPVSCVNRGAAAPSDAKAVHLAASVGRLSAALRVLNEAAGQETAAEREETAWQRMALWQTLRALADIPDDELSEQGAEEAMRTLSQGFPGAAGCRGEAEAALRRHRPGCPDETLRGRCLQPGADGEAGAPATRFTDWRGMLASYVQALIRCRDAGSDVTQRSGPDNPPRSLRLEWHRPLGEGVVRTGASENAGFTALGGLKWTRTVLAERGGWLTPVGHFPDVARGEQEAGGYIVDNG